MLLSQIKRQLNLLACVPSVWLSGGVIWLLESFVFLLFMQPVSSLTLMQKMGLLWGVVLFSYQAMMGQYLTRTRVVWLFESDFFSCNHQPIWLLDLLCLYIVSMGVFLLGLPLVVLLYEISVGQCLYLYWLCLVSSPVCFMQMYLARLVALFVPYGMVLSVCIVLPWILPEVLLVMCCLREFFLSGSFGVLMPLLIGVNMIAVCCLYHVITVVLKFCYRCSILA